MTETVKRPLSRDLVLETAVSLADHEGLGALSMRRLGQELGVEAMSLYHHVANKEALLDGMVDAVVGSSTPRSAPAAARRLSATGPRRCGPGSSPRARSCSGTSGCPRCSSRAPR